MVRPGHLFLLLLSLIAASLLPNVVARRGPGPYYGKRADKIKAICARTVHHNICEHAAAFYRDLVPVVNLDTVLSAQIAFATDRTKEAQAEAREQLVVRQKDLTAVSLLKTCLGQYKNVMEDLKDAVTSAAARDFRTTNIRLKSVMSYYESCDDGFTKRNSANPLAFSNDLLKLMVRNALVIIKLHH